MWVSRDGTNYAQVRRADETSAFRLRNKILVIRFEMTLACAHVLYGRYSQVHERTWPTSVLIQLFMTTVKSYRFAIGFSRKVHTLIFFFNRKHIFPLTLRTRYVALCVRACDLNNTSIRCNVVRELARKRRRVYRVSDRWRPTGVV